MNTHLRERVKARLEQYTEITLGTCGQAGPQISIVSYQFRNNALLLFLPRNSDHLFNLEHQPRVTLLTPTWKLDGHAVRSDNRLAPHEWQTVVQVQPDRLHILSEDRQSTIETIDF